MTSSSNDLGPQIAKKLGFKAGMTVCAINVPEDYGNLLGELPEDVIWAHDLESPRNANDIREKIWDHCGTRLQELIAEQHRPPLRHQANNDQTELPF